MRKLADSHHFDSSRNIGLQEVGISYRETGNTLGNASTVLRVWND